MPKDLLHANQAMTYMAMSVLKLIIVKQLQIIILAKHVLLDTI